MKKPLVYLFVLLSCHIAAQSYDLIDTLILRTDFSQAFIYGKHHYLQRKYIKNEEGQLKTVLARDDEEQWDSSYFSYGKHVRTEQIFYNPHNPGKDRGSVTAFYQVTPGKDSFVYTHPGNVIYCTGTSRLSDSGLVYQYRYYNRTGQGEVKALTEVYRVDANNRLVEINDYLSLNYNSLKVPLTFPHCLLYNDRKRTCTIVPDKDYGTSEKYFFDKRGRLKRIMVWNFYTNGKRFLVYRFKVRYEKKSPAHG